MTTQGLYEEALSSLGRNDEVNVAEMLKVETEAHSRVMATQITESSTGRASKEDEVQAILRDS